MQLVDLVDDILNEPEFKENGFVRLRFVTFKLLSGKDNVIFNWDVKIVNWVMKGLD